MINQVRGTCLEAGATWVVVDLGGFGVKALCTPATSAAARPGHSLHLHTSLVVREDSLTLYGFAEAMERDAFELVQTASGVGPKLALAVVSVVAPADFVRAVQQGDLARLTSVPGIGAKGAQKMVIELKDKVAQLGLTPGPQPDRAPSGDEAWRDQVSSGLQGLGWSSKDADAACEKVAPLVSDDPTIGVGQLMRAALRSLAR
ncbi:MULTISPECIES: Holliday junction branch migration protein RuvA [Aestuariimicrobium]|uniref:Holliday junction branch migration protein RuvA n=1 Tax=Aestuariimicrobium TaxID=396388 RepID=UPI0003B6E8C7|nr:MULTISPECIES: Holliday junction branch migration protein RuvA [Aestuariimicrobium]CAI9410099.1 Holliday junction ATP-dependent DNA helicase RuvA [Aestuariimicrobium sp. T2.26MG-19.2B]